MITSQKEIWRDIVGYEGYYKVSNTGFVRSIDRSVKGPRNTEYHLKGKLKHQYINRDGYCTVHLKKEGKSQQIQVHRLVAIAFIPNINNLPQVNHIDGNKANNRVENLEWVTAKQNMQHAIKTGLLSTEICKENGKQSTKIIAVHILCKDSGEVFNTEKDACIRLKITSVSNCNIPKTTHNGRGFTLEVISDKEYKERKQNQLSEEEYNKIYESIWKRIGHQGKQMKIYCVEQDKYYKSLSDASRNFGVHYSAIAYSIKHNTKCKGLTFKCVE